MRVSPTYSTVGSIFNVSPLFMVPKYQRGYAWDKQEIDDFLKDLEYSFQKRVVGNPEQHFFGGIVSVKTDVVGAVNKVEYEVVDGQQRIGTFVLLVAAILKLNRELLAEANAAGDNANRDTIQSRIDTLTKSYIEFSLEINLQPETRDVLILSNADKAFYRDIIRDSNPNSTRNSHDKIEYAFTTIFDKVHALTTAATLADKMTNLGTLTSVLEADFTILHIVTDSQESAYKLFQVLNNRGKSLTEGDLLRAKTLEILEGHQNEQSTVESLWDDILKDSPSTTEKYLRWVYSSIKGSRPGNNTLFNDCLDFFYPFHNNVPLNAVDAQTTRQKTQLIGDEVNLCRDTQSGVWSYPNQQPILSWDRNRLSLLVRELRHELSMPLLLAAKQLSHTQYAEIVHAVERVMFRYIAICNQRNSHLVAIYHSHAVQMRANPANYNPNTLYNDLRVLINDKAPDHVFRAGLEALNYKKSGGNKVIKYFLMTIEYYLQWYRTGANGTPVCVDKSRVYDFSDTTIEHIYPRSAQGAVVDATLEPHKNLIGNLTILSPNENGTGANDDYATKTPIYQGSSVQMNNELVNNYPNWDVASLDARKNDLIDIALRVFTV